MIVGLTGGIASGKTLVSQALSKKQVRIIDADDIARQIVAPGQPALRQLAEIFGEDIVRHDGQLDRAQLRARAFVDDQSREALNAITHPAIRAAMMAQMSEPWQENEALYRVLSVPLLLENGLQHWVEMIVVVDVDEKTQLTRASMRDHADREAILRIMQGQWPRTKRLSFAHRVIDNHGSRDDTLAQVTILHEQLTALARQSRH